MCVDAPEEVVCEFFFGWFFEGFDLDAQWVDAFEDRSDSAVFAGGIHALEEDEQAVFALGVEHALAFFDLFEEAGGFVFGFVFIPIFWGAGGGIGEQGHDG